MSSFQPIKRIKSLRERDGQALIEAVASIGIIIVSVFGALAFLSSSLRLNRLVTNQYTATYLAAGMIEEVKNCVDVNDNNWNYDCQRRVGGVTSESVNGANFTKSLTVTNKGGEVNDEYKQVIATVSWEERGEEINVILEDRFYNWRQ